MSMTLEVAQSRKRKKHKDALGMSMVVAAIVAVMALTSWVEYQLFDFAAPWVRIVGIALIWMGTVGMVWGRQVVELKNPRKRARE